MTSLVPPEVSPRDKPTCNKMRPHCNSLWAIWYGVGTTGVHAILIATCMRRFAVYASLPWPHTHASPKLELNAYLGLVGVATLVLPFFLVTAIFKVGNLANDGLKLGHHLSTCSRDPAALLPGPGLSGGGMCTNLWRHGGPTAPFLHLVAAFCLLLPKLIIEAKLIQAGFLPKSDVWVSELSSVLPHRDQLTMLDFLAAPNASIFPASSLPPLPTLPPTASTPLGSLETFNLGSISPEFLNFAVALVIYAVRYPAVFWKTNKCFGTLFSIQLFIGAIHSLVTYNGISVLYKIQVCYGSENNPKQGLLLDAKITLALYALSGILVLCSSLVLYLHGYCKFSSFINRERAKRGEITMNREMAWGYFPHCAALCVLIAAAVVYAPLLHDSAVIYRGTLDTSLLACVIAAIGHLFLWVVTWLLLTVKRHWTFKLRVTIGRATLRSARSIKLVTDVDLRQHSEVNAPLLVVGNGRTYTVAESSPKKAIMAVIQRSSRRTDDEQIYWLRPNRSAKPERLNCRRNNAKVTFDEPACNQRRGHVEDDGDYATLRELTEDSMQLQGPVTPRCRADSGVAMERSHSVSPESSSPRENSNSSETSSGVHSNSSNVNSSALNSEKRSNSVDDVSIEIPDRMQATPWPSHSLQRNSQHPTSTQVQYGFTSVPPSPLITPIPEATVVIRRKQSRPKTTDLTQTNEPFERSTNMRMTSFTDQPDGLRLQDPYPQQLGLCHSFPRGMTSYQPIDQNTDGSRTLPTHPENLIRITENPYVTQQSLGLCHSFPRHTTIPTHHNGVRLFPAPAFTKRLITPQTRLVQETLGGGHHSFPHVGAVKYSPIPNPTCQMFVNQDRDSANYSMVSSGDSDSYSQHT